MSKIVKDHLPETNCKKFGNSKIIACDDYINKDGNFDFKCCEGCGWNPFVAQRRIEKLVKERGWAHVTP